MQDRESETEESKLHEITTYCWVASLQQMILNPLTLPCYDQLDFMEKQNFDWRK